MSLNKTFAEYLQWQSKEKMNSSAQAAIADNAIDQIPKEVQSVLCIGIGDGYEIKRLKEIGIKQVTGITLNLEAVRFHRSLVEKMDMYSMQYPDNSFDLVFAKDVFEHAFSHWAALKEMVRVSSQYIIIILPDPVVWSEGVYHTIVPYPSQMTALAKKFNLKLIKQWTYQAVGHHQVYGFLFEK